MLRLIPGPAFHKILFPETDLNLKAKKVPDPDPQHLFQMTADITKARGKSKGRVRSCTLSQKSSGFLRIFFTGIF